MPGIILWTLVAVFTVLVLTSGSASADPEELQPRRLGNGLEVLVQEDHTAPLVCCYIWYRVGIRNEGEGEAGLTHFLEHMAFKGTERLSGREMNRLVTARGGYLNGFTSMDYTAYVEVLPRDALAVAFEIESERMARCTLSADDLEAEKGVVISEFEGAENDPSFLLRREVMAAQFPGQPYGRTVLGDKDDLRALTPERVTSYYERHYAPNNAVLVVVGDVSAEEVFAQAEQHFGSIPRGEPVAPAPNPGSSAAEERRVALEMPGRTSYFQAVYQVPPTDDPDHIVLEVFQNIVSGGRTSRLYRALVDTGLAASAGGWDYENPQPTVFAFEVVLRPGVTHEQVEEAFDGVLEELQRETVEQRELDKARNRTVANFVYEADGVTKLARQIGYYHIISGSDYLRRFPERVAAVTAEDIQRVARRYFVPENRTVGRLTASGEETGAGGPVGAGPRDVRWSHHPEAEFGGGERASEAPVPAGLGPVTPVHESRLPNGMQVLLQENHSAPFVTIYSNVMAGPAFESPEQSGLASFCAEMLSRGTTRRSWEEIREALEFEAADLGFGTGVQVATVGGRCLRDDLRLLLEAAAEQLLQPAFPEDEIEKVRSEMLAAQAQRDDDTYQVAEKEFLAALYPEGHPLRYPPLGTEETVARITREDLVAFHARYYRPENTILAVVGDLDPAEVEALVREVFGGWERGGEAARPELPAVPVPEEPRVLRVPVPSKTQTDVALGFPGMSRSDPGYYQADLMNYLLGRAFMSRLNMHIREELGLAYYVWSNYYAYWGPGPWVVHMGVNPANVDQAVEATLEELRRMQQEPPSEEEMDLWKGYVEGTVARRMETFSGIAQNLVSSAFYELGLYFPYQYPSILEGITAEQVQEAARQFLHPEGYVAVIAGPVEEAEE